MRFEITSAATAAALLLSLPSTVLADDLYLKSSPVLRLNAQTYDKQITYSNHTSVVEFYAPWCGHCQRLKPAFEKAAKNLKGLAKVAAVNCDESKNKAFCGTMGIKGFPTIKIVRPSKKGGYPTVEDYNGERNAKSIVNAVVEKITNHVKRLTPNSLDQWLGEKNETAKAILFTEKGTVSAMWRALAIDYLSVVNFGQVRNKETELMSMFGVEKVPAVVILPGGDAEPVKYEGELTKDLLLEFVKEKSGVEPNPDPPKAKPKKEKKGDKKDKKAKKEKAKVEKVKEEEKKEKTEEKKPKAESKQKPVAEKVDDETVLKDDKHTPEKYVAAEPVTEESLRLKCLSPKSTICALVILPPSVSPATDMDSMSEETSETLKVLTEVYMKHFGHDSKAALQFHVLDNTLQLSQDLRSKLELDPEAMEIVALNAKRGWFQRYGRSTFLYDEVHEWVDGVKFGQGTKGELPDVLVLNKEEVEKIEKKMKEDEKVEEAKKAEEKKVEQERQERDEL